MTLTTRNTILSVIFFISGAAGLGYEIVWTRMFAVALGHEIVSLLAVLSAFFCGIALGASLFDGPVCRSGRPEYWYLGFEAVIGLWALLLIVLIPVVNPHISSLIGLQPSPWRHWSTAFVLPFLILLPATAAMGGTLAAMDRYLGRLAPASRGSAVAWLYGINTFGALTGTLAATFLLLPSLGMRATAMVFAGANICSAAAIFLVSRKHGVVKAPPLAATAPEASRLRIYLTLFTTGLLGIGFEVLMVRSLSQYLENTVFTFASLLTAYLFGTAAGASLYHRFARHPGSTRLLNLLLHATALSSLASIFLIGRLEALKALFTEFFGRGFTQAIAAEFTLALLLFLLPTMAMGAVFSLLAGRLRGPAGGVGRALSLNTLGGAVAPLLFGLFLLPQAGLQYAFLFVVCGYLVLLPSLERKYLPLTGLTAAGIAFIALTPQSFQLLTTAADETVVFREEGVMASVAVIEDEAGHRHLKVNNHFQMGGTGSAYSDLRQAHLPLFLHSHPKSALFLGLGTGITFSGANGYPDLEADGVELLPEVVEALPFFKEAAGDLTASPNLKVITADARRYVTATAKRYDVVVADLFHPSRDGAGGLYTVEHFRAIQNILLPGGLFCQWLPLYQMDLEMLKTITASFLAVFPEAQAYLAHYSITSPIIGLIGANEPLRYPEKWYRAKMRDERIRKGMLQLRYDSFYSVFGTFLGGTAQLRAFAADSGVNTDNTPVVLFRAPRFVYRDTLPPQERLFALLEAFAAADPESVLAPYVTEEDYLARDRLKAYWQARDRFLQIGAGIVQTRNIEKLYAAAKDPLLSVVRTSLDFSAAYFPLLTIAYEIYPYDRNASYALLSELMRANPMRREAGLLRRKIFQE